MALPVGSVLDLKQFATPSTSPAAGEDYLYVKSDDGLYVKTSGGVESKIGPGAGGPPTGAAGGDLTGSYPNPTIAYPSARKMQVKAATIGTNITLAGSAPNTLDGVTLAAGDRILVKDQTTTSQNGIYTVTTLGTGANGTWTRATDMDAALEFPEAEVSVSAGTLMTGTTWYQSNHSFATVGTSAATFLQMTMVPVGTMMLWPTASPPTGWVVAEGGTISNTTAPVLAALLGDTYGPHSGANYVLPKFRPRFSDLIDTTAIVAGASWSVTAQRLEMLDGVIYITAAFATTAAITGFTQPNHADQKMGGMANTNYWPETNDVAGSARGQVRHVTCRSSTGDINVTAGLSDTAFSASNFASGDPVACTFVYPMTSTSTSPASHTIIKTG